MIPYSTATTTPSKKGREELKLCKDYTICVNKKLGKGSFGQLYLGRNYRENNFVAIKIEDRGSNSLLFMEYEIMKELSGGDGIPKVYFFHEGRGHNYLIMQLLGRNLEKLFIDMNKKFSLKTICMIAYQLIQRVEYIHSKGYIHRDIKPENILIGRKVENKKLYIIDFGISKKYVEKNGKHIIYKEYDNFWGTLKYASLNTHKGIEQSRRDDIETIAYNLIYLAKGKLPWEEIKSKTKEDMCAKVMEVKKEYKEEKLCEGLPEEFCVLLQYARKLGFDEEPDYKNMKIMFKQLIYDNKQKIDWNFDWDIKDKNKRIKNDNKEDNHKSN